MLLIKICVSLLIVASTFATEPAQLLARLFKNNSITFIQIGSHEGNTVNDPLFNLIKKHKWKGVLVEPVPYLFERLQNNYRDTPDLFFENSIVSTTNDWVDFYYLEEKVASDPLLPSYASQLGSLVPNHITNHLPNVTQQMLSQKAITFHDLVEKYHITHLDLLHTDTEGHDIPILLSIDFDRIKPVAILFEHNHSDGTFNTGENYKKLCAHLESVGYQIVHRDYMDTLAVLKGYKYRRVRR